MKMWVHMSSSYETFISCLLLATPATVEQNLVLNSSRAKKSKNSANPLWYCRKVSCSESL